MSDEKPKPPNFRLELAATIDRARDFSADLVAFAMRVRLADLPTLSALLDVGGEGASLEMLVLGLRVQIAAMDRGLGLVADEVINRFRTLAPDAPPPATPQTSSEN